MDRHADTLLAWCRVGKNGDKLEHFTKLSDPANTGWPACTSNGHRTFVYC